MLLTLPIRSSNESGDTGELAVDEVVVRVDEVL
jgi:hypothetical protein